MDEGNQTIIFTIGRMNPPTSGHLLLIRTMMKRAMEFGEPRINVILSHTTDNKKNPLECRKKREILIELIMKGLKPQLMEEYSSVEEKEHVRNMEVRVLCTEDPEVQSQFGKFPMNSINTLLSEYPPGASLHLIIGEDRATDYQWIMRSLKNRDDPIEGIIEAVPRPEGAMSATYIRSLVTSKKKPQFLQVMRDGGMDETIATQLYDELKTRLTTSTSTFKNSTFKKSGAKGGVKSTFKKSGAKRRTKRRTKRRKH
jgi:nicotinic acid mononucleotide adenylyltransferase